ncbi:HprK-related kinase A [Aliiglaciecola sp. LCG003]|uniref:HprK-related kinase A n=1 Tax=Aliiglaciecola sp. LCG003 TaxID=3053655 RepID=UPI0025732F6A|nr:HprK-related kinase A [Aliiglaciecola sp. LCG003]WJG08456.1 HprK-related kinase A [Aliiglaciecola sp. LCG003]
MLRIHTGLYHFDYCSQAPHVDEAVKIIYGDVPELDQPVDFKIRIIFESLVRRFIKPQVSFFSDQHSPFKPLPVSQAAAVLEWGMNWCIAAHEYNKLLIHAAVLVKNGKAIIFPALPGSGKSTLTAYLGLAGWSTYSDEMAVIDTQSGQVSPLYRPVCLKNNSIELVKSWHPAANFTPICRDTQKGDVAHVKVMDWQRYQSLIPVPIVAVVFPKYRANTELTIYQLSHLDAFNVLSKNAFNYNVLAKKGFETVDKIIRNTAHFEIEYDNVADVDDFLTEDIIESCR